MGADEDAASVDGMARPAFAWPASERILGVRVDAVTMAQCLELAKQAVAAGRQMSIFAVNPEKIVAAQRDAELCRTLERSELLIPDGIGAVLALRSRGVAAERVPGSELMPALCERAAREAWPIFLLGAREEVNRLAAERLRKRFPGLQIAGRRDGYFSPEEFDAVLEQVNRSGAKLLFVAMGSPRQEQWINSHREALRVDVLQGVGGTFDVIAGTVKRAPVLWRRLNLEWLYRLLSDPRRLLRQRVLPVFAWQALCERLRHTGGAR